MFVGTDPPRHVTKLVKANASKYSRAYAFSEALQRTEDIRSEVNQIGRGGHGQAI